MSAGRYTAEVQKSAAAADSARLKSINILGGSYKFSDNFSAALYASDVENVLKKQYINLNYVLPIDSLQSFSLDFHGYKTKLDREFVDWTDQLGRDNKIWSLAANYTYGAHSFTLAHQRSSGDTGISTEITRVMALSGMVVALSTLPIPTGQTSMRKTNVPGNWLTVSTLAPTVFQD